MPRRRRRDHDRLANTHAQALNHPLRLRILEMHKRAGGQSLSVETLTAALGQTIEYEHVKPAEVAYHRNRLLDAELLSASTEGSGGR